MGDETKLRPMVKDPDSGVWRSDGLNEVDYSNETIVRFDSRTLNDFALFPGMADPAATSETGEADKPVESLKELGSSSGCFLESLTRPLSSTF